MSKILIVDDLPTGLQLMNSLVGNMGHATLLASDGEQALEMTRKEKPDLVLLDVVLPRMDGFQVCRKIKKDPQTAAIPVVLVTSKSQESDRFWGFKQGACAYLCKPFSPEELADTVRKHLH